jgi:glycosyltransferase involved in cell wall biosynthesis
MDKMSGLVLRAAKKAGIPIRIAHSHNTRSEGGLAARSYKWIAGQNIRPSATHLLACSTVAAKWLYANRADAAKILHNGIECEKFAFSPEVRLQVRTELELTGKHFVVGHVGRFAHQKNHGYLLERFAEFLRDRPDAVLVLVGDGPLRAEMQQKAEDLKLAHKVKFLGVRGDIHRLLQAFDVFFFPSLHEGLPVTLIEAQGAGLPCLIADTITREVDMGVGLVEFFPLADRTQCLEKLHGIASATGSRTNPAEALTLKGYDIKRTAEWTKGFYLSIENH